MSKSSAPRPALAAGAADVGVVLTCGSAACQHTFEPDPIAWAAGDLECPRCCGWTFQAALADRLPGGEVR